MLSRKAFVREARERVRHAARAWRADDQGGRLTYQLIRAAYQAAFEADQLGLADRFLKKSDWHIYDEAGFAEVLDFLLRDRGIVACRKTRWKLAAAAKWAYLQHASPKQLIRFLRREGGLNACAGKYSHRAALAKRSDWD